MKLDTMQETGTSGCFTPLLKNLEIEQPNFVKYVIS